jgi:uncharacterized protein (TIGR02996 family)
MVRTRDDEARRRGDLADGPASGPASGPAEGDAGEPAGEPASEPAGEPAGEPASEPAYLVFADWLQAQGHPWGELIVLQHRAAQAAERGERAALEGAAARLLEDRGAEIVGELPLEGAELTWQLGFVRRARLRTLADKGVVLAGARALLAAHAAHMLERLVLDPRPERFDTTRDWDSSTDNIVDPWPDWDELGPLLHGRVPHLGFGGWPAAAASAYVRMPGFDPLSRWLRTTVRALELTGSGPGGPRQPLELLKLVELDVRYADAGDADLEALASSRLPALERYAVSLGGSSHCILDDVYAPEEYSGGSGGGGEDGEGEGDADADVDVDVLRYPAYYSAEDLENLGVHRVSTHVRAGALRRLLDGIPAGVVDFGMPSSMLSDELLDVIVGHPRIPTLRRLDLSACMIGDQNVAILFEASGALARIGAIDLSRNRLTARFVGQLAAALPNAIIGEQGSGEPDFFMRYVATME